MERNLKSDKEQSELSKLKKLILKFKQLINEHPFKMGLFIGGFVTLIILLVMGMLV